MQKTGKNLTDLLDLNRSQILHYIMKNQGCSRAELGKATGLTLASITKTINALIQCGAIYETGFAEGKKGRRTVGLSFNYDNYKILAIELSWDKLEMQPYDFSGSPHGKLISISYSNITAHTIEFVINNISDGIKHFHNQFPEISAIGISVPGPYYRNTGKIMLPPYNFEPEYRYYYPLKDELSNYTDLPIFIEHDADASALGYSWFVSKKIKDKIIMNILADFGVGIGVVDTGEIYTGTNDCSCEMGHISIDYNGRICPTCGGLGCINAYCSTLALEQIATELLPKYPNSVLNDVPKITFNAIINAKNKNDELALKLAFDCGKYLGHGIISLLHVVNPDIIVISGAISTLGQTLMQGITDTLLKSQSSYITIPKIELLEPETPLTILGAAAFAIDRILDKPTKHLSLSINN